MVTIKQIAELAGVSRGTVDRVLNNRGKISPETELRVRNTVESLNYKPNKAGRNLALRQKKLKFAFILFSSRRVNPFFEDVVTGIKSKAEILREYGAEVEILYSDFRFDHQAELLDSLICRGVSGVAITPINHPAVADKMRALSAREIPVVTVNTDIENSGRIAYIGSNYLKSGRVAGSLMSIITGGNAKIGVITGSDSILCHADRVEGFRQIIGEKYPGLVIADIRENQDDDIESYNAAKEMLTDNPDISAVFLAAAGVYGACRAVSDLYVQPKIICYDCVPTTKALIKEGIITAAIDQQAVYQGQKPLDVLFDFAAAGSRPDKEYYYTNLEIIISENIT